jgi:hypothetical protein
MPPVPANRHRATAPKMACKRRSPRWAKGACVPRNARMRTLARVAGSWAYCRCRSMPAARLVSRTRPAAYPTLASIFFISQGVAGLRGPSADVHATEADTLAGCWASSLCLSFMTCAQYRIGFSSSHPIRDTEPGADPLGATDGRTPASGNRTQREHAHDPRSTKPRLGKI